MTVSTELARLRKERGWSQAELARRAGLSPSTIAMYETGRRTPDDTTVELLASTLCTPANVLTGNADGTRDGTTDGTRDGTTARESAGTTEGTPASQSGRLQGASTLADQRMKQDSEPLQSETFIPWQLDSTPGSGVREGIVDGPRPSQPPTGQSGAEDDNGGHLADLNLRVSADEARVVLAMRMRPAIHDFLLSYVSASDEERERLARTWHVIRSFQTWTGDGTP